MKTTKRISLLLHDVAGDKVGTAAMVTDEADLLALQSAAERFDLAVEAVTEIPAGTRLYHAKICDDGTYWTHSLRTIEEIDKETPAFTESEQELWDEFVSGKTDTFNLDEQDVSMDVKLLLTTPV